MTEQLWYDTPASHWNEALPVGDGSLGAMVFAHPYLDRMQLNVDTLWEGGVRDRTNPAALAALPVVRQLLFAGRNAEAAALAKRDMLGVPQRIESYQPLADLHIGSAWQGPVLGYRRWLDLDHATACATWDKDGIPCRQEVFASRVDHVLVVRLTSADPRRCPHQLRIRLEREEGALVRGEDGDLVLSGVTRCGLSFAVRLRVVGCGSSFQGTTLTTGWERDVVLLVAGETAFGGGDEQRIVRERLDRAAEQGFAELARRHRVDAVSLMDRVRIDLGGSADRSRLPVTARLQAMHRGEPDPGMVALALQYRRHLQICSSRPGTLPSNLQGIWNERLAAPWNSDFHPNINLQMNYWPHERAALPETIEPLIDWLERLVPHGERTAQRHYGCRGWVLHHVSDPWGCTTPCDSLAGLWPVGGAWLVQHLWWRWEFSRDRALLATRLWPLMRGALRFILDFLVEAPPGTAAAGCLVMSPSHSPENTFRMPNGTQTEFTWHATMDTGIVAECLSCAIAACDELGCDPELRAEAQSALLRLPPYRISERHGGLQEWIEDYEEVEPGHRHLSHLFGLFPGRSIDAALDPQVAQAARRSLERRLAHQHGHHQSTGWALGWISCLWARLGEGALAWDAIVRLLAERSLPNLMTDAHGVPQVGDAHGVLMGFLECLVQDHRPARIDLLPALPPQIPDGSVTGLRLRGAHRLDLCWRNGRMHQAVITGGSAATVEVRWPGAVSRVDLVAGGLVELV